MQNTEPSKGLAGYARVIAAYRVQREATKPLFGKAYIKFGQCYGLWGYFFQLGGVLGARHSVSLDAFVSRFGMAGDPADIFMKHGMEKIGPDDAAEQAWQFAEEGAAMGAIHPEVVRRVFERQHTPMPAEDWKRAHDAGLDIPPEQDQMSYDEVDAAEEEGFMAYCLEGSPQYHSILSVPL